MKLMLVTNAGPNYGPDTLYDGLCRLLGCENVLDYPTKAILHGGIPDIYQDYPCLFNWPVVATDQEKLDELLSGRVDALLVACRRDFDYCPTPQFRELLHRVSAKTPTFLLDQYDLKGINSGAMDYYHSLLYFKREFYLEYYQDIRNIPLSFGYPVSYCPASLTSPRPMDVFWAGGRTGRRRPFIDRLAKDAGPHFVNVTLPQSEYRKALLSSRIGLSLKGYGWDTVRYWEVPAHETLLFAHHPPIFIDNDFTDGVNAVFFSNPDEMMSKLTHLLSNPPLIEEIRARGWEHFWACHTTDVRASQLMGKIQERL